MHWWVRCSLLLATVTLCFGCPLDRFPPDGPNASLYHWYELRGGCLNWWPVPSIGEQAGTVYADLERHRGLCLVDLEVPEIATEWDAPGIPRDLHVLDNRVFVAMTTPGRLQYHGDSARFSTDSTLYAVDIARLNEPSTLGRVELPGELEEGYLVGDRYYAVSTGHRPSDSKSGDEAAWTAAVWLTSIDVSEPGSMVWLDQEVLDGLFYVLHADGHAIVLARIVEDAFTASEVTCVGVSAEDGQIEVMGTIDMGEGVTYADVYDGVLRVVTDSWRSFSAYNDMTCDITMFDLEGADALSELGRVSLDTFYMANVWLDGPRALVAEHVSGRPVQVVDLSEPAVPYVLELPLAPSGWGFSGLLADHLFLVWVGEGLDFSSRHYSLFDLSDTRNPLLVGESASIGCESLSELEEPIADGQGYTTAISAAGGCSPFESVCRTQFVSWSDSGVVAGGCVETRDRRQRAFTYQGTNYVVTNDQFLAVDASDVREPVVLHELDLSHPEYVADYLELSEAVGATVITDEGSAETVVRTVDASGDALGEISVHAGDSQDSSAADGIVVLTGRLREAPNRMPHGFRVTVVDCTDPRFPTVRRSADFDLDIDTPPAHEELADYRRPYLASSPTGKLTLAFVCATREPDDDAPRYRVFDWRLVLLDLDTATWTSVGVGDHEVVWLRAVEGRLYVGTKEPVPETDGRSLCHYYLRDYDLDRGTLGAPCKVPGFPVQYEPGRELLVVLDERWKDDDTAERSWLRTMRWDGRHAPTGIDALRLPRVWVAEPLGDHIFVQVGPWQDYALHKVEIAETGELSLAGGPAISQQEWSLAGGRNDTVYVSVKNRAFARFDFSQDVVSADLLELEGDPVHIRLTDRWAYVALGHGGAVRLPL